MSVFLFKMQFMQIALKAKTMGSFLPISAAGAHNDRTDFAAVKLKHFRTVAAASCLCQK